MGVERERLRDVGVERERDRETWGERERGRQAWGERDRWREINLSAILHVDRISTFSLVIQFLTIIYSIYEIVK